MLRLAAVLAWGAGRQFLVSPKGKKKQTTTTTKKKEKATSPSKYKGHLPAS